MNRNGHYGPYGGSYVAETLAQPLDELADRRPVEVEPRRRLEVADALRLLVGGKRLARLRGAPKEKQLNELHVARIDESADERVQVHASHLDVVDAVFDERL